MALQSIIDFRGIDTVTSPYKVSPSLGTQFLNVDTSNKTLKSAKGSLDTLESTNGFEYWYKAPNYDIQSHTALNVVYHNGFVYSTAKGVDGTSRLVRTDTSDSSSEYVGIDKPDIEVAVSDSGEYYLDENFTYAYYYYAITYYDSTLGEESEPYLTEVFGAKKKTIELAITGIDLGSYDKVRIYRVGNYITKFTLVDELDILTSINYSDTKPDTALTSLLTTRGTMVPPTGLCNIVKHNGSFFASVGSRLRFSKPGNANSWDALAYIDFEADIVGLGSVNGLLIIFLRNKVFVMAGQSIKDFRLMTLTGDTGCANALTIASFRNYLVWISDNGITISDGTTVKYVTKDNYEFPEDLVYKDSDVLLDRYYLLSDQYLYEMDFSGSLPELRLYDNVTGVNSITAYETELYGLSTNKLKFFKGSDDLTFKYQTKDIVGTAYNYENEIEKISVTCKGNFLCDININNDIINKNINNDKITIEDLKLPVDSNDATHCSLYMEGVGEVFAINFNYASPEQQEDRT